MAIENTYLLGKNITLGCGFDLQAKAPLDSRQTVPSFEGLRALIIGDAAYEGMIVYDEGTKKTYQAQKCESYSVEVDGKTKTYDIAFREFGINEEELKDLIASETTAAMEFKGATATLPENPAKGDMWKVTASFEVAGEITKVGDSIVYNGEEWFRIPSGDDIEDTWRIVTVGGTSLGGIAEGKALNLTAGAKLDVALTEDGDVVYSHEEIAAPTATPVGEDEQTRTYIASIETDGYGHITGYKTATENVEDTNTTYTFEGQSDEATSVYFQVKSSDAEAAEVIYFDAYSKNEADGKFVAKETGKSLISDTEIARLAEVDNYDDEEVRGLIGDNAKAIDDLEKYVGTIPEVPGEDGNNKYADLDVIGYINKKAQETLAAAQGGSSETAASVKAQLDDYIGENNTRVKAVEDDVAAIKDAETGILKQAKDYADGLAGNYDEAGAAAGVKTELTTEINKKVDKVEGKDLIATSEIERLATLANYDDTQVKADIAKKADAETMTTELGKKVDKVTGYSLVSDTEIARLANVTNYDDTQVKADIAKKADSATMTTELGKKVDKVEGYSLVADTEIARLANVDNYDDGEVRGLIGDNADAIDAIEADYLKAADKTELSNAIALKADKSVVEAMYTNGQIDGFLDGKVDKTTYAEDKATFALKSDITSLVGKADKTYVDEELAKKVNVSDYNNDKATFALKTDLNVYRTSADQDVIDQDFEDRIAELEAIDHDKLAKDASAAAVATVLDGAPEKFDTLKEIAAWIAEADTAEDAASLVTRVSALEAIDHDAYVDADAELKEELEGKINAINNHSHTFVETELNEIKAGDVAKWNAEIGAKAIAETKTTTAEVKDQIEAYGYATTGYADGKAADAQAAAIADAAGKYETKTDAAAKLEEAKTDASNKDAVVLSEAQKYADQAEADAIAAAEGKVNALAGNVYTKEQTYTKSEVESLLTWGSF